MTGNTKPFELLNPVVEPALEVAANPVSHPEFDAFVATIRALRAPDGCPWDKEQTHKSISSNMIEEAYEAVDAIEANDIAHMREELGDVLLQVVLQAQIAEDQGEFTIRDVCNDVNAKIVRRHPHVFGDAKAGDANEVLELWDAVKLAEKQAAAVENAAAGRQVEGQGAAVYENETDKSSDSGEPSGSDKTNEPSLLDGVPVSFPALMQAQKISRKAAAAGFEWESIEDIWDKVSEEVAELKEAYAAAPKSANGKMSKDANPAAYEAATLEFGDVLFSLVNVARRMGIDSESALRDVCRKFRMRWAFMEDAAANKGQRIEDLSLEEQEMLWQESKAE